jgi:hypothetical protein
MLLQKVAPPVTGKSFEWQRMVFSTPEEWAWR